MAILCLNPDQYEYKEFDQDSCPDGWIPAGYVTPPVVSTGVDLRWLVLAAILGALVLGKVNDL